MRTVSASRTILAIAALVWPGLATGQAPQLLGIEVPAVQIQGDFLLNGAPTPSFTTESARLRLDGRIGLGSGFPIGRSDEQSYGPISVIPTEFQPGYAFDFSVLGTALPINPQVPIGPFVSLDGTQPFDVDIPSVGVTFDVTLNGDPFGPGILMTDDSELLLRHVETGGEFVIGSTLDQPLFAWIVPGTYDLVYRHVSGRHPANTRATIAAGLQLTTTQTVTLDVEAYGHQQTVSLNGSPFIDSQSQCGHIALESPDGRDRVDLGPTSDPLPQVTLIAGTYSLVYELKQGGSQVPANERAIVDTAVVVEEPPPLDVSRDSTDIQASLVSILATLNGSAFPVSASNWASWVVEDADGHETLFGDTISPGLARSLVHGTYDVLYRWRNGFITVPRNANARVATGFVVSGPTALAFDVPMVTVTIQPLLNGAPWPASPTQYGQLYLEGSEPGDRFLLGETFDVPEILALVIAGRYGVDYEFRIGGLLVPINDAERLLSFDTADGTTVPVDVAATRVDTLPTLNGQPFPTGGPDEARLVLRSWSGGEVVLGTTDAQPLPRWWIIDGAYRIDYEWQAGDAIPRNSWETIGSRYVAEPSGSAVIALGIAALVALRGRRSSSPALGRG